MNSKETYGLKTESLPIRKYQELCNDSDDDRSLLECETCSKTFSGVNNFEQHLNSKKHHQMISNKKMLKKLGHFDGEKEENVAPEFSDELMCDICEKTCSGYKSYIAHMNGGIHAKNVKQQKLRESLKDNPEVIPANGSGLESEDEGLSQKPFARCSVCDKVFYDPTSYQNHMNGSNHKRKMLHEKTLLSLKSELQDDPQIEDEEFFTMCAICNKQFSGPVPFKIHLQSSVHENQVKRMQEIEKLKDFFHVDSPTGKMVCKECKKMFTDPFSLKLHLENNRHENQTTKSKVLEFLAVNPEIGNMKSFANIPTKDDTEEEIHYEKNNYFLVCNLCRTSFSGLVSAEEHVLSKKHIRAKDEKNKLKLLKIRMSEIKYGEDAINGMKDKKRSSPTSLKSVNNVSEMDVHDSDGDDFELVSA